MYIPKNKRVIQNGIGGVALHAITLAIPISFRHVTVSNVFSEVPVDKFSDISVNMITSLVILGLLGVSQLKTSFSTSMVFTVPGGITTVFISTGNVLGNCEQELTAGKLLEGTSCLHPNISPFVAFLLQVITSNFLMGGAAVAPSIISV
jgi:hypothetical protein